METSAMALVAAHEDRIQTAEEHVRVLGTDVARTTAYQKELYRKVDKLDSKVEKLEKNLNDKIDTKMEDVVDRISDKIDEVRKDVGDLRGKVEVHSSRINDLEDKKKEKTAWKDVLRKAILILIGAGASQAIPKLLEIING